MPKELIASGWIQSPCQFFLAGSAAGAGVCGDCEGEFRWWSKGHCMFCGYLFHRNRCSRKIQLQGSFFTHRICSKCHYYRDTAQSKLQEGEKFECIDDEGVSSIVMSLCEGTAELQLHWKTTGIKKTYDLAVVQVRKGFSHVLQHVNTCMSGTYEPLQSFSVFVEKDGEQCAYNLRASSALTCQLWVEGLKAASYVYHKMIEQNQALEFYSQRNTKLSPNWHRKLYLPNPVPLAKTTPSPTATHDDDLLEEWVDIVVPPYTPPRGFSCSSVFSPTATPPSPYSFQSDHTLSFCSSIMVPASQRQALTVHSLRFPTSRTHTAAGSWQAVSPPTTPALPSGRKACLTDCLSGPSNSQSSAGSSVSPTLLPTSNLHNPITLSQFQNF